MFSKKKTKTTSERASSGASSSSFSKGQPSVISAEMSVLGNIVSDGFVDIDGIVDGNVKCHSTTIRANGKINGDITAEIVKVYGMVTGMIKARSVTLHETAHVEGIIMHESLSVEDGAFIDGKFKRMDKLVLDDEEVADYAADDEESAKVELLESLRIVQ